MWRQQRYKTDPEYSPENHVMPFCVPHAEHAAGPIPARLVAFVKLKPIARFRMEPKRSAHRIVAI
jgi:hypothetical protein